MQASLGLPVPYMNSLSVGEVMSGYRNAEIWGEHLSKVLNRETNYTEVWSLMESQVHRICPARRAAAVPFFFTLLTSARFVRVPRPFYRSQSH